MGLIEATERVSVLVANFGRHVEAYRGGGLNEAQVRAEYIDPLFEALGWDVYNRLGYAHQYRDVILEYAIKVGGTTKAPDYCFRIGPQRKFFLEAKKPSVSVRDDAGPAYQLRRYAWSAGLPLSVLTDFEEFAVYDCTKKPLPTDKAGTARIMYLTFDQYAERLPEIYDIFARESVLRGSFDKFSQSQKGKRGTQPVDESLLKDIEVWRDILARNIALRNPRLSTRDLNFAVQSTIDRIIFLRICEDRGIEPYEHLRSLLNGANIYKRLLNLFYDADDRYNSGLFHFRSEKNRDNPDLLTPSLALDDKPLKDLIEALYYPKSSYEFSIMPAEILGQVYEQFLGKVIRLTKGHHAVVEDKPEVKKAGGVYYTPGYIVDYIVKNTVGKLLSRPDTLVGQSGRSDNPVGQGGKAEGERRKAKGGRRKDESGMGNISSDNSSFITHHSSFPKDVSNLRILDPACGSGSFLIGAYQYLLDWHLDYYINDGPEKHRKEIYEVGRPDILVGQASRPDIPVGQASRPDILVGQASRPDIPVGQEKKDEGGRMKDESGLKNMSDDNSSFIIHHSSLSPSWRLTSAERKRILLNNIYGVDIDPQAVEVTKLSLLLKVLEGESQESLSSSLKLFKERALPDLSKNIKCGNSLIGPDFYHGRGDTLVDLMQDEEEIYRINAFDWHAEFPEVFSHHKDTKDTKVHKGKKANDSSFEPGFDVVIGNPPYGAYLSKDEASYLSSNFMLQNYQLDSYYLFIEKSLKLLKSFSFLGMIIPNTWMLNLTTEEIRRFIFNNTSIASIVHYLFPVFKKATVDTEIVIIKNANPPSDHNIDIIITKKDFSCDRYILSQQRCIDRDGKPINIFEKPEFISLANKLREFPILNDNFVITQGAKPFQVGKGKPPQTRKIVDEKPYVSDKKKDTSFKPLLRGSLINKYQILWDHNYYISFGDWLAEPRYSANYDANTKIVIRQTGDSLIATLDKQQFIVRDNLYTIIPNKDIYDLRYLLGLLNSNLLNWFYQKIVNPEKGEALAQVKRGHIASLPICIPNLNQNKEQLVYKRIIELVDLMLDLHQRLSFLKTVDEKVRLERQIVMTDREIDRLVYDLYGLSEEEIRIVEGGG